MGDNNGTLPYCTDHSSMTTELTSRNQLLCNNDDVDVRDILSYEYDLDDLTHVYSSNNSDVEHACAGCDTPPCRESKYSIAYSGGTRLALRFAQQVEAELDLTEESIQNNLIAITINYGTIQYALMKESKSQSFSGLVSDLGGQLGFFMGISIISVVELVIELIGLRLLPRFLFGNTKLYGVGQKQD
jgi:hypothetical protein